MAPTQPQTASEAKGTRTLRFKALEVRVPYTATEGIAQDFVTDAVNNWLTENGIVYDDITNINSLMADSDRVGGRTHVFHIFYLVK